MRNRAGTIIDWPAWRYGPGGESAIFTKEEDVPYGWVKTPGEKFVPVEGPPIYDRDELIKELQAKGVQVQGQWSNRYMKELLS